MSPVGCCHKIQLLAILTHWYTWVVVRVDMDKEGGHMVNGWGSRWGYLVGVDIQLHFNTGGGNLCF
jgi:hypothetical protein